VENNLAFLRNRSAVILTLVLLLQAAVVYGFRRQEVLPQHQGLEGLSREMGTWTATQDFPMDKETMDVLKADDTLNRNYQDAASGRSANLFVAFFKSQRTGQAPHSPKNCLPGSGWVPTVNDVITVAVPGRGDIEVNRYVIQKGEAKSLVLYWYQSRDRVVASEYKAKVYVVADALRYNRSDTALVRVVMPLGPGQSEAEAATAASEFIRTFYRPLRERFPA